MISQTLSNYLLLFTLFLLLALERQTSNNFLQFDQDHLDLLLLLEVYAQLVEYNSQYLSRVYGPQILNQLFCQFFSPIFSFFLQNQLENIGQRKHRFSIEMLDFQDLSFHKFNHNRMHSHILKGNQLKEAQDLRNQLLWFLLQ